MYKFKSLVIFVALICLFQNKALKAQGCTTQDSLALLVIENSISDLNWDLTQPVSSWNGVTLDSNGCVEKLTISYWFLAGFIPPEIGDFTELKELKIYSSGISGVIPPEIGNLFNLEKLEINSNSLLGAIPPEIGNLTNLEYLRISNSNITGTIPPVLGNLINLESLNLSDNLLFGTIPPELGNLVSLSSLKLQQNSLVGNIPPEFANLSNLEYMRLSYNDLFGSVPAELEDLSNLSYLALDNNTLSGSIPPELGNLQNLYYLNLSHNNLIGEIPAELGNLSALSSLILNENNLMGSIPVGLTNMTSLSNLYLYNNSLSGCYEEELAQICLQLPSPYTLNNISAGNNFDAEFFDFCFSGDGVCIYSCSDSSALTYDPNTTYEIANCVYPNRTCYAVAEQNAAPNTLFNYDDQTQSWTSIGVTGTAKIEAIAFDQNSGILYAYDESTLGSIDLTNAQFTTIGSSSPVIGELGLISFVDVDGMAHDAIQDIMYATDKIGGTGNNDVLFQVDLGTGEAVLGAMNDSAGNPSDYAVIEAAYDSASGYYLYDVDDVAIHPATGELYVLHAGSGLNIISIVDKMDGSILQQLYTLSTGDVEGLTFNNSLELIGSTGSSSSSSAPNSQIIIDYINQTEIVLGPIDPSGTVADFEGISCYQTFTYGCIDATAYNYDPTASFSDGSCVYLTDCAISDSLNLIIVYDSLELNPYYQIYPMEFWPGSLQFNADGCVTHINLDDNAGGGSIAPAIGNLSQLISLNLNENGIGGTIPPEMGNLVHLESLSMDENNFTGPIPPSFANLENLSYLNLRRNDLTGPLPDFLGSLDSLTVMYLDYNDFTGSIPPSYATLSNLTYLGLDHNDLSGCYDPSLSVFCTQLTGFGTLNGNISNGNNFDDSFEDFCDYGEGACFSGCMDPTAFNYDQTAIIDDGSCIYYNCLVEDSLTMITVYTAFGLNASPWALGDPISSWPGITLNEFGCVTEINLYDADQAGTIPPEIGDLASLVVLNLDESDLSGTIPPEIGNLSQLEYLEISDNNISGTIPPEIGNLQNLEYLNLSTTNLSGAIPSELGDLFSLENLVLSYGLLTGAIPSELSNLSNIQSIDLSNNSLTGTIPEEMAAMTHMNDLILSNNNLSGCFHPLFQNMCNPLGALVTVTNQINTGNNFNDSWYNFCLYDDGVCCEDSVYINTINSYIANYTTVIKTSSDAEVSSGTSYFSAGQCVELLPGFEVKENANFTAEIEGCNP